MALHSFTYKGYAVFLAATQPSKRKRGGKMRSMQIRTMLGCGSRILKTIRYDTTDPYAFGKASEKATKWIDEKIKEK